MTRAALRRRNRDYARARRAAFYASGLTSSGHVPTNRRWRSLAGLTRSAYKTAYARACRRDTAERRDNPSRIDLSLAICAIANPGIPLTHREIAAWCGCTDAYIWSIESRAIRKLRRLLLHRNSHAEVRAIFQSALAT